MTSLVDPGTGSRFPLDTTDWRAPSGRPWMLEPMAGLGQSDIHGDDPTLWRYRAALPVEASSRISLGEGRTPLLRRRYGDCDCYFKLEWFSPTGSFKDRGVSVMMSQLAAAGVTAVVEDSSGNAGAATAAYAAAAGIEATILVPAGAQSAKIDQARAYGARVLAVPGERTDTEKAAVAMAEELFYAGHNWNPFFLQGTKTLGYELWEDLDYRAPDNVIIPTGAGSLVLGCHLAFGELLRRGEIDHLPRLFVSQPAHCAPIYRAFMAQQGRPVELPDRATVAEGTAIRHPLRLPEILAALEESGGAAVAVSEADIVSACDRLAGQGLYVDPSCSHAAAALESLVEERVVNPGENSIVVLTGTGLKTSDFYRQRFPELEIYRTSG